MTTETRSFGCSYGNGLHRTRWKIPSRPPITVRGLRTPPRSPRQDRPTRSGLWRTSWVSDRITGLAGLRMVFFSVHFRDKSPAQRPILVVFVAVGSGPRGGIGWPRGRLWGPGRQFLRGKLALWSSAEPNSVASKVVDVVRWSQTARTRSIQAAHPRRRCNPIDHHTILVGALPSVGPPTNPRSRGTTK